MVLDTPANAAHKSGKNAPWKLNGTLSGKFARATVSRDTASRTRRYELLVFSSYAAFISSIGARLAHEDPEHATTLSHAHVCPRERCGCSVLKQFLSRLTMEKMVVFDPMPGPIDRIATTVTRRFRTRDRRL